MAIDKDKLNFDKENDNLKSMDEFDKLKEKSEAIIKK